jgi:hypothetical protein
MFTNRVFFRLQAGYVLSRILALIRIVLEILDEPWIVTKTML